MPKLRMNMAPTPALTVQTATQTAVLRRLVPLNSSKKSRQSVLVSASRAATSFISSNSCCRATSSYAPLRKKRRLFSASSGLPWLISHRGDSGMNGRLSASRAGSGKHT